MKSIIIFSLFFLLAISFSFSQNVEHWVELGLKNSPTSTAQQAKINATEKAMESVYEYPETQLQISAIEWMPNDLSPYFRPTISLSQDLPWFGTKKTKKEIAQAKINSQQSIAKTIEAELTQKIKSQYIELQHFKEKTILLENHKENLSAIHDNLLIKLESGQTAAWEVILLENEINNATAEIKKSAYQFKQQKKYFELLIGTEAKNLQLDSLSLKPVENINEIQNHPNIVNLKTEQNQLEAEKKQINLDYSPKLSVGIHYEAAMPVEPTYVTHDMIMPTLGLSFPLFANKKKSKKSLINAQQQAISADIESKKNRLNQELISTKNNLFELQTNWETKQENIKNTEDVLELLWTEYEANNINFQDIIRVQTQLIEMSLEQLSEVKNHNQLQTYLIYLLTDEQN